MSYPTQNFFLYLFYNNQDIELTDITESSPPLLSGIGEFCLRIVCQVSGTSSKTKGVMCKYTILLFPATAEELAHSPESRYAGYPGLRVGDGHFPLGPTPGRKWRCPIIPFVKPGTPFSELDSAPASYRLRFAIASVMGKVVQPYTARTLAALHTKWDRIRANPKELPEKAPATCWPSIPPYNESQGNTLKLIT